MAMDASRHYSGRINECLADAACLISRREMRAADIRPVTTHATTIAKGAPKTIASSANTAPKAALPNSPHT
jgi:hypothetical protein